MMRHESAEVQAALTSLLDALCTWERETGRESAFILREVGGFGVRAQNGKPVPDYWTDAEVFEDINASKAEAMSAERHSSQLPSVDHGASKKLWYTVAVDRVEPTPPVFSSDMKQGIADSSRRGGRVLPKRAGYGGK